MGGGYVADYNKDGTVDPEETRRWQEELARQKGGNGFKTPWGTIHGGLGSLTEESESAKAQRAALNQQGASASGFADLGQQGYGQMTQESQQARDYLRRLASGQDSVSAEQLRQGMQQGINAQRSMAASASPANAPMAARNAAMNMGRLGSGLAGQQAVAGLQERQAAQQGLANLIMQQRGQDLQAALGSRQNAISGYGGVRPEGSWMDKWANPLTGGLGAGAKLSDERLKEDIEDGDSEANKAMKGLRAFTYKYRDRNLGKDRELGVMAQGLEEAGLKHTIIETPRGKAVHGAALSTANTAMLSALERRVAKIEGGKK